MNCKIVMAALAAMVAGSVSAARMQIKVTVVDDDTGKPIEGVTVVGQFQQEGMRPQDIGKGTPMPSYDSAKTDHKGRCLLQESSDCGMACVRVDEGLPDGYYSCGWHACQVPDREHLSDKKLYTLSSVIRLQRIGEPIPLCVQHVGGGYAAEADLFEMAQGDLRFDLLVGDWLPPLGTGVTADVVFARLPHRHLRTKSEGGIDWVYYQAGVSMRFAGEDNGVCPMSCEPQSTVRIKTAPQDGYATDTIISAREVCRGNLVDDDQQDQKYYAFRIRTKRDESGKITEAYYGKIFHGLKFANTFKEEIVELAPKFLYYVNPKPLDRNLEWNLNNLLKNPTRGARIDVDER